MGSFEENHNAIGMRAALHPHLTAFLTIVVCRIVYKHPAIHHSKYSIPVSYIAMVLEFFDQGKTIAFEQCNFRIQRLCQQLNQTID